MSKKTRLQMFQAGELPTFQPSEQVIVGGRHATFVSYDDPMGDLYATVKDSFHSKQRHVFKHLIRKA